ncbi:single-stranded DNA binding protein [Brevibacillus phage Jimmer1]|uniref:Single-stranded DNA-binding protein n=2 Tax=Jimmervirus jimmer TaxID=1984789 RepID=S5MBK0_9CAUD|nr:single strand DNA binding protein [Brevibacillus phage Jimmer1]YP_009606502.1 single strand DNA binding protein [Brevibacillus phage Jimmer2]AGR47209.1 single-stranded DNA binding protein [Brevibacillus phage Jimmer2]AGR47310.1 single-stranded DNA binding protein [Brevibacillus phage Jimmer1]
MLNRVILIGRLTKDPDMKYTPNGVAVTTFTIAVDRRFSGQSGEKETDFIGIVAWRQLADLCTNYLRKGKQCAVEGRLQTRSYDNKEGKKVYVTEVVADNVQFLGSKDGQAQQSNKSSFDDPFASNKPINISDDDLPF